MQKTLVSRSAKETCELGRRLGLTAAPGSVFALCGDLGAGKTVCAQGFAAGLGVREPVNSPTFTILQIYESGRLPLYHMDAYRLEDEEELEAIGGTEYLYGDGVCLIEWAGIVRGLLPEDTVFVEIDRVPEEGPDCRRITLRQEET